MAKHDLKNDKLQVNSISSTEVAKITATNTIQYSSERVLEDLDLVYWGFIKDLFPESGEYQIVTVGANVPLPADGAEGDIYFRPTNVGIEVYQKTTPDIWELKGTLTPGNLQTVTTAGLATTNSINFTGGGNTVDDNTMGLTVTRYATGQAFIKNKYNNNTALVSSVVFQNTGDLDLTAGGNNVRVRVRAAPNIGPLFYGRANYNGDYSAAGQLEDFWIPHWKFVKDYVDSSSGGAAKKVSLTVTGQPSISINWKTDIPSGETQTYQELFGDFGTFQLFQDPAASGNYSLQQPIVNMTLDAGTANVYTIQLDNFNSILLIS